MGCQNMGNSPRKTGAHQNDVQQSRGCLGSSRWFSTIVDVTHSGTAIYVGGAIAIEEDRDLGVTYVDAIFWQFARNSTRTSVDSMAGLDSGEGCVGTRRALCRRDPSPSRQGLGRSRRDVRRGDGRAGPRRFALPRHLTRRHRDPQPQRPGRADRNSEKINGGRAEREVYALASELFGVNFRTKNCSVRIWKTTSILKTVQKCEIRTRAATHATGFSKFTLSTDRGRLVDFSSNC
jgi:hypothetical protein